MAAVGGRIGRIGDGALFALVLCVLVCVPACRSEPVAVGPDALAANWSFGILGVNLSPNIDVQTVIAAAENALTRSGQSVTRRSVTPASGRISGSNPVRGGQQAASVFVSRNENSTRVEVMQSPAAELGSSRDLMNAILAQLQ